MIGLFYVPPANVPAVPFDLIQVYRMDKKASPQPEDRRSRGRLHAPEGDHLAGCTVSDGRAAGYDALPPFRAPFDRR